MMQWINFNLMQLANICMWHNHEVHGSEYMHPINTPNVIIHVVAMYELGFLQRNLEENRLYREKQHTMVKCQCPTEGWCWLYRESVILFIWTSTSADA
jgi:hypothetical protein